MQKAKPISRRASGNNRYIVANWIELQVQYRFLPFMNHGKYVFSKGNYILSLVNSTGYKTRFDKHEVGFIFRIYIEWLGQHYDYKRIRLAATQLVPL